ncbi:D-alanyl-D-alanine carboxypeptidase family protein [Streptomyces inusitatus]|uniref:D-alanyl-D-alanine carboxypeptidase family protein n=1 Tax=Streptomyces inusitatus TaxID=68221 RepID=UPI0027E5672B|nr:serine hydrolase [Streptomyces inusitatus]
MDQPASSGGGRPEPGTETGSVEKDKQLRSAVAAWVASADEEPDGEGEGSDPADETAALPETAAESAAEETALLPEVKVGAPAKPADADADTGAEEDAGDAGAKDGETIAVPAVKADTDEDDEDKASGEDPAPKKESAKESAKAPVKDVDKAPAAAPAKPPAKADKDADADADKAAAKADDDEVDHPTTAFKAITKPEPADDSPTRALKIPPAPRTESNPARKTPAERPSTFVPLRGDEDVRTASWGRKDTPAAPAAASAPARASEDRPQGPASPAGPAGPAGPTGLAEAERTSQQPLPPQPPLDLLAQLTNTPDTPVRSALRRVKIWTPLVLLLLVAFAVVQVMRPLPEPRMTLSVDPSFTFEGGKLGLPFPGEGQGAVEVEGVGMVATYGAQKPAPIASVTKTMTAYLILRDHPLTGKQVGEKITIDRRADEEYEKGEDIESVEPVEEGQQYTQREMLEMLMISSANNVARLLARWDAGSEKAFVAKMNAAAKDLGMKDTVYTDPSGLSKTTVSTPQDQLKLAKAAMKNDVFRSIVDTPHVEIPTLGETIYNGNGRALLKAGIGGIKTGSSTPAGGNLLWAAQVPVDGKDRRILGVTLGIQDAPNLTAKVELAVTHSIRVIEKAQEALTSATVVRKGDVVGRIDNGLGGVTPVVATKDLKAIGWAGHEVRLTIDGGGKTVPGSGAAGDEIGRISVGTGPGLVSAPVALQRDMAEPGFGEKLTRVG